MEKATAALEVPSQSETVAAASGDSAGPSPATAVYHGVAPAIEHGADTAQFVSEHVGINLY